MHKTVTIIAARLVVGLTQAAAASSSSENRKTEESKVKASPWMTSGEG